MSTQARLYKLREILWDFFPITTTRLSPTPRTNPCFTMLNPSPLSKKRRLSFDQENHIELATEPIVRRLLIMKHSKKARVPTRGSALAAGYDLYRYAPSMAHFIVTQVSSFSAQDKVVPAHGKAMVDTQLSIAVPDGTYGRIAPRSGLGLPPCSGAGPPTLTQFSSFKMYD
jgi:hypothetical protein